jgi:hypothetical protein
VARAHGKILTDIWVDPDFLALGPLDQWAYFMLLSQPKLSLVGSMDYEPHRWTAKAAGLTPDALDWALYALERAGFVCIDRTTRELLVRSMTRHDGLRANNPKILKGMWGQWKSIASPGLRKVAVDNMPDALFDSVETPNAAEHLRRSPRMDWAIEGAIRRPIGPPSAIHHPPPTVGQSDSRSVPDPTPTPPPRALVTPEAIAGLREWADELKPPKPSIDPCQVEALRRAREETFGLPDRPAASSSTPVAPIATPQTQPEGRDE